MNKREQGLSLVAVNGVLLTHSAARDTVPWPHPSTWLERAGLLSFPYDVLLLDFQPYRVLWGRIRRLSFIFRIGFVATPKHPLSNQVHW